MEGGQGKKLQGVFRNGRTDRSSGTCWLSSTSSASPPLRVTGVVLRADVTLICLWVVGTVFGTVGDVLMGPERQKHTCLYFYACLDGCVWAVFSCLREITFASF